MGTADTVEVLACELTKGRGDRIGTATGHAVSRNGGVRPSIDPAMWHPVTIVSTGMYRASHPRTPRAGRPWHPRRGEADRTSLTLPSTTLGLGDIRKAPMRLLALRRIEL